MKKLTLHQVFFIRGQALPQSNEIKFLRIITDDKLSFGNQIDSVCKKVRESIAVINKLSTSIHKKSLSCIYARIVYSHVIYSVEVWGKTNPTKLRRLRRRLYKCLKTKLN